MTALRFAKQAATTAHARDARINERRRQRKGCPAQPCQVLLAALGPPGPPFGLSGPHLPVDLRPQSVVADIEGRAAARNVEGRNASRLLGSQALLALEACRVVVL